jgi:hypothetical protein
MTIIKYSKSGKKTKQKAKPSVKLTKPKLKKAAKSKSTFVLREESPLYRVNRNGHHHKFNFVDLFCGAGGFSKGFELAGFTSLWANDVEQTFCDTYKLNHPDTVVFCGDIRKISVEELRKQIGYKEVNAVNLEKVLRDGSGENPNPARPVYRANELAFLQMKQSFVQA